MKVLISGSSGFVGSFALSILKEHFDVVAISLRKTKVTDIDFKGIDAILHLAGKAHQMSKIDNSEYFKINHQLTLSFAKAAKESGVKHFVFISSIKVYGDQVGEILDENSECFPTDPYGESKLLAEKDLIKMQEEEFKISIIRPPLIYGPNAKGNLARLKNLINKLPILPFGNINNKRSMVYVGNLTSLIIHILKTKPQGIFIAGDQDIYSTSHLVEMMIKHMNVKKRNISIPDIIQKLVKYIRPRIYSRLFDSYIISNHKTNEKLSFNPPYSFEEGIKGMVQSNK